MLSNINWNFIFLHFIPAIIFILGWIVVALLIKNAYDDIRELTMDEEEEEKAIEEG